MENRGLFLNRMEDLADKAARTGRAASRFLTPAEAAAVAAHFSRRREVKVSFDGGYEGAERVRAIFLNPDRGAYDRADLFAVLKITCRPQDSLGHRDILGALMALGIERDTLGDIHAEPGSAALVCLPEISGYIAENLTKAGRTGVRVSGIPPEEFPAGTETLRIKTDTVASLRLDAVLCSAFGLSRGRAADMIGAGLVSLNHEPCLQPAREVPEGAVLSVRGLGRARFIEAGGTSRKGRRFIKIGLYGR